MGEQATPPQNARDVPAAPKLRAPAEDVQHVADLLLKAKNPVIVAEKIGRAHV